MSSAVAPFEEAAPSGAKAREVIHVINPLWDAQGGSDWRAIEMYKALRTHHRVRLWSRFVPEPGFCKTYPVELIRPWLGRWPIGGTFIFVGAYFRIGHWFKAALPQRTILVYNTYQPDRFAKVLARLQAWHRAPVEVVYTSPLLRSLSHVAGPVIESPIDLSHFSPARNARPKHTFTVGRMSRDLASKHHHEDPAVYAALAAAGVEVRVMGGHCLSEHLQGSAALLAAGSQRAGDFLRTLDCFFYRTSERWLEAYGRVVFEAMACGLPVVCGRRGGYADYIEHGINGFLVDSKDEALAALMRLRDDLKLRQRIGRAARRTVERIYSGADWSRKLAFFLPSERDHRSLPLFSPASDPTPSELR